MDNLKDIFEINKDLIKKINKIVFFTQTQNYDRALRAATEVIDKINIFINTMMSFIEKHPSSNIIFDQIIFLQTLQELLDVQEKKDYILLADLYEAKMLPILMQLQESIIGSQGIIFDNDLYERNVNILCKSNGNVGIGSNQMSYSSHELEKGYAIEPTSCGAVTLAVGEDEDKYYFHSNINVYTEAFNLANSWYSKDKTTYVIYGLGLAYHISELHNIDEYIEIEVYESDINIIKLACAYTDNISLFDKAYVKLVYDPDFTLLTKRIGKMNLDTEFVIHYPSLKNIKNKQIRESLEDYFIQQSSINNQLHLLNGNFRRNIHNYDGVVDDLREEFEGKDLYIVAAGPSLDLNFKRLKEVKNKGIILATGTVFRKLISADIIPDYLIVTDANARVYKQIAGYEDYDIPMLFLSTAYYGFASNYKGKKYIICQKDYRKAEELASQLDLHCFLTGGSVSTTALDIGITFKCRRIIFLGLDLAYTNNYAHASDTSRRNIIINKDMISVEDINGQPIYTNRGLNMFRQWIESRIKGIDGIEFIDASEGGAKIKGMKVMRLDDVIN